MYVSIFGPSTPEGFLVCDGYELVYKSYRNIVELFYVRISFIQSVESVDLSVRPVLSIIMSAWVADYMFQSVRSAIYLFPHLNQPILLSILLSSALSA